MSRMSDPWEARRSPRFSVKVPLRYRRLDATTWMNGITENVSSEGVLFICDQSLPKEAELEIEFVLSLQKESGLEVSCRGTVIRSMAPLEGGPRWALAAKIGSYRMSRWQREPVLDCGST
jgi:hypothetical protein